MESTEALQNYEKGNLTLDDICGDNEEPLSTDETQLVKDGMDISDIGAPRPWHCARFQDYAGRESDSVVGTRVGAPKIPVWLLPVDTKNQRSFCLAEPNGNKLLCIEQPCIHQLFERQVLLIPEEVALIFEEHTLTYAELNWRANGVAHALLRLGVVPDQPVAICVDRSSVMIVCIIAILKSGGAYLPLDPHHSSQRVMDILYDCKPNIILADGIGQTAMKDIKRSEFTVLDPTTLIIQSRSNPKTNKLSSANLACVIYTNDSKGKPKGVLIEHRNIVRMFDVSESLFQLSHTDFWSLRYSITSDVSVWLIWGALCYGGKLILTPFEVACSPTEMYRSVCSNNITVLTQTPSAFKPCIASYVQHLEDDQLRLVLIERRLQPKISRSWFDVRDNSRYRMINVYSRAEVAVEATNELLSRKDSQITPNPIGRRLNNLKLYFCGKNEEPIPFEVTDRLYIGSSGIAPGTMIQPDSTAKRILPDVFSSTMNGHIYGTEDLIRDSRVCDPDFIRRNDRVSGIPLPPDGELDTRELLRPDEDDNIRNGYEEPSSIIERSLALCWSDVLGIKHVGRNDSFFEMGGHSLHAAKLIEPLRSFGLTMTVRDVFENPVLSDAAKIVQQHVQVQVPRNLIMPDIEKLSPNMLPLIDLTQADIDRLVATIPGGLNNIQDIYALSPLQHGILFHYLLVIEGDPYLIMTLLSFKNRSVLERYLNAVQIVVDRHDILRTAFVWEELSEPAQVVLRRAPIPVTEHSLASDADYTVADQLKHRYDPHHYRIDIRQAPLMHFHIAQESDGRWILLELQHHLIGDHQASDLMSAEIASLMNDGETSLPKSTPFRHLIAHVRLGITGKDHERFFTEMLSDIPGPSLPFDLGDVHNDASKLSESEISLSPQLLDRLRGRAKFMKTSLATLCHLAWAQVVSRTSNNESAVFGTVLFGRMGAHNSFATAMGLFINTLPIRIDVDETSVYDCVLRTHTRLTELFDHEHTSLALAQKCSGIRDGTPLFNSLLNYRNQTILSDSISIADGIEILECTDRTHYPLDLSVDNYESSIRLSTQAVSPVNPSRLCAYAEQSLESIVNALELTPNTPVRSLQIIPENELSLLLEHRNESMSVSVEQPCIHQYFEQRVPQIPQNIALICGELSITYAELNTRANVLAHVLIRLGVTHDQLVAICVDRSPAMIICILAILKAGGAYLPLDPHHSSGRLIDILNDGNPKIILADDVGYSTLKHMTTSEYTFVNPNSSSIRLCTNPKITDLSSANLAYVIYTSGSTGKPKGVLIEHRNIVRMLDSSEPLFRFTHTDVWSLWYSITSDVSVWLIWGALCYGGTLVLIPFDVSCSPTRMYHCVCSHKITILDQTPTAFRECIANYVDNPERDHLRLVFLGGERLDPKILRTWFRVRKNAGCKVINMYGPTETTVQATYKLLDETDTQWTFSPIGWRFTHLKIYVLSTNGDPVPCGVTGELYIGGGGVARGYLNRPDLTAICFLPDPFSSSMDGRMYRTGDLVRYLPDGNLEFVGRNDRQLKVRGFRIEPGEIEARLIEYHSVYDAAVVLSGEDHDRRLIAYIVADAEDDLLKNLRTHVAFKLPEYMVPNAFVRVAEIPSTPYGELDIEKLPKPNENDVVRNEYEKPSGEVERGLASAWSAVLGIELIGRHDSFFQMGGNSLQAMRVIERLKVIGITMTVRDLFEHPVLSDAATFLRQHIQFRVPPNLIRLNITKLTPSMLPLIDLTQADIDWIVSKIPGGLNNIQDIYALSSLQEGIFFHYLHAKEGDPYLSMTQLSFKNRSYLERYLGAVQSVVDRHDIFRTAFLWKGISTAAQVVLRRASIHVSQHSFAADGNHSVADELKHRYNPLRCRIDIMEAPLMHFHIAQESDGRWILHELQHHLIADHETIEFMSAEISSFLDHNDTDLPDSIPFRNLVALTRLEMGKEIHERFFTEMLADVTEPSLVFDIHEVFHDGPNIAQSISSLSPQINDRLREQAKLMTTSLATLCHVAWAQVVSRTSNNEKAVFGTVLFGRMGAYNNFANAMGLFMNTLPIRIDVDETPVFECVRRTHTRLANLFSHEHTSLVLAQRCSGIQKGVSLFNSLLNFRHSKIITESESASTSLEFLESMERSNYPLDLSVDDFGKSIQLVTGAVHPLDPSRFCAYMEETLNNLTIALQVKPKMFARSLRILPQTERSIQIDTWNEPITSGVEQPCIHQLFERRASLNPEEIALIFEEHTLTYAELNRRANVVADALLKLGVKPDQPVAICVDRSFAMIVCIIAILKSGGAYLPLDPHHSSQRLIDILYDCKPSIILADEIGQTAMKDIKRSEFTVVDPTTLIIQSRSNPKISDLSSRNLAYIIYTSGSTGKPKGVLVEHRNIVRMFDASGSLFQLSHTDVWSLWYSITSDVSVWLIWGALCYGGKLVLIPFEVACSPTEMYRSVCSNNITVLTQTPSAFKPCIASYVENPEEDRLRLVLLGGERLYPGILRSWFDMRDNSRCRVINVYGPTEATVQATYKLLSREDTQHTLSPIGRRFTNSKLYILDNNQEPVPFGVTGELYIGGGSIARGYHNRPDLTTTRFLSDPLSSAMDGRIYKTGDLVRYLPNGDLDFIGRNDRQFKIRGFRIEPGEIEACLMEYDLVRAAAVVVFGEDHKQRLVAYVVAEAKNNLMRDLRNHTAVRLPDYMVPSAYVRVSEIPLTPNGKLDTEKLPEPDENDIIRNRYEEPSGNIERSLALCWSDVLGIEHVGRNDSFFEMGGHSLHAVRLIERLRSIGLAMTVRDVFENPVLSDAAKIVQQHVQVQVPRNLIMPDIEKLSPNMLPLIDLTQADIDRLVATIPGGLNNIQDIYALSPLQHGILFHYLLVIEGDPYLIMTLLSFKNRSVLERYLNAVQIVVDRHDILRTAFVWEELSEPAQVVLRRAPIPVTEHSLASDADYTVADQLKHRYDPHHYRIDIRQAPLMHFHIAQESDGRWILLELQHHLIGDHQASDLMSAEIASLMNDGETSLPKSTPFRHLIAHVRLGITGKDHERFFTEMLSDIPGPSLPFDLGDVHNDASKLSESEISLSPQLLDRLRGRAKFMKTSLATLCHLAWAQVVSRTSNNESAVFGTVLFGRMGAHNSFATAMGLFINTLPIRIDVDETSVYDCVLRTHTRLTELFDHEHTSLALAQKCSGIRDGTPLFNSLLNYRNQTILSDSISIADEIEILECTDRTHYPLDLSVDNYESSIRLSTQAVSPVNPSRLCAYAERSLESIVNALELTPNTPVRSLQIIPENELSLLLEHRNESMSVSVEQPCIHQYFEQRVPQIPQNIALICGELSITYAELNTRANVLAHVLIRLGVTHDQLVAICVDRSPAMIICILAILKAGGAYLPLDPHHSSGRLIDILNDGNPKIILADDVGYSTLKHMTTSEYTFVNPNSSSIRLCTNPKITDLSSANLAYVIYTSGSTGKPKGVLIEHRNIVRMLDSSEPLFRFTHTDVWSLWYSITSDVSVWLIWGALCYGGTLVLIPFDVSCSPTRMYHCVCSHKITILDQTPTAFRECIANYVDNPERDHLRLVFLGGERLDPKILRTWFRVRKNAGCKVINMYGPTETTVQATYKLLDETDTQWTFSPIGWRFTHLKIYVLSTNGDPVPCGVTGELYIGGGGVARGYLNRPDLTAICFLPDPFSSSMDGRMYRTGDLVRYLPDGNLEFVGRNDRQLKVRGFRIEPGEIEARLIEYHSVYDAAVVLSGEDHDRRLIAYIVADAEDDLLKNLRTHVAFKLPEYMVPNAFVRVAEIPSTPYGELDIEKLPKPNENDVVRNEYEKPSGEVERGLASAWSAVLGIELIGRHDSFFQMGGNSLQAMRVIERLKVIGITMTVRDLFEHPVLSDAATFLRQHIQFRVPPNLIRLNITKLTPSMLPLIDLTQADIDWIVSKIPGGLNNIQDIYALSSLQEGIFFHYLHAKEGDPYLSMTQLSFKNRSYLERYLGAVQSVVDRHDIFRTAFLWKGISTAAQVVLRRASIHVSQHSFAADGNHSVADELKHRYNPLRCRIDIMEAPLMHFHIAQESDGRWILHELQHHLIADHETIEFMSAEISSFLDHNDTDLPDSIPFRNLVALTRLEMGKEIHERFFTEMLADVTEPSLVFDIHEVFHDGPNIAQSISSLSPQINDRLREQAKLMTTSLATLCHVAWAQVVSRTSNNEKAVFGTVLFGRMGAYNNFANAMGLFMNTLPIRIDVDETPVFECVRRTHTRLANLFSHEHTSLVLAQRCSGIQKGVSLFNSLLNFRHSKIITESESASTSLEFLESMERSNYPLDLSVDDFGKSIQLVTGAVHPLDPSRFCAYMEETLNNLTIALQVKPKMFARSLRILPQTERSIQIDTWNEPITSGVEQPCIHQLFERRASLNPEEIALIFEEHTLTYAELNRRANVVADALLKLGVKPDQPVAICVDRSFAMIVCIIAILKSGGAYLPLDPHHSSQRLIDILYDCKPSIILADEIGQTAMKDIKRSEFTVVDPTTLIIQSRSNPKISDLSSRNLAYIIYTSGSTGKPKGVLVEHRNIVRMFDASGSLFQLSHTDVWSLWYSITSDVSVWLIWGALCYGGKLVLIPFEVACSPTEMYRSVCSNNITVLTQTPSAFKPCIASYVENPEEDRLRLVLLGGERLYPGILRSWFDMRDNSRCRVINVYGPTEATVQATYKLLSREDTQHTLSPIGRRFTNSKLYILDNNQEPVPFGVTGELYIGGGSIARGYHNRPDLTTTRFLSDPLSSAMDGRIYKTGDLVRYLPNGDLDFIGRNDRQFKIRGFRIEPGEIEACLMEYDLVRAAAVVVFGEDHKQRLVAYVVAEAKNNLMRDLRNHTAVRLPDYMVPSAYVRVSEIPLTPNGKLDTEKLPEPDENDIIRNRYEEPSGNIERSLALCWSDVLGIEHVGRNDSFFEMGGHSLHAVRLIERLRSIGLAMTVRDVFENPVLSDAAKIVQQHVQVQVPRNLIMPDIEKLSPNMLPLIDLTQADIDRLVATIPGGLNNIQDIYALSPLQHGILFHYLLVIEGDPYLIMTLLSFKNRSVLERYLNAVQIVVDRHDILRTAFVWEELSEPAQVVLRRAPIPVTEHSLASDADYTVADQLKHRYDPHHYRIDIRQAPLMHFHIAQESDGRWILLELQHHLIGDHQASDLMSAEIASLMNDGETSLPKSTPFRHLIAHVRLGITGKDHERFFTEMLSDIPGPSLPFDLGDVHNDASKLSESEISLSPQLLDRLRGRAKFMKTSLATLCHLAWAQVVSRTSNNESAVFGTVLFGRMGAHNSFATAMGLFINTLPIRIDVDETSVYDCVLRTHTRLTELFDHEHTSLALAQKCSGIRDGTPLFNSLLNYRNQTILSDSISIADEIEILECTDRTHYPLDLSVDNYESSIRLSTQAVSPVNPSRLCAYAERSLESIVNALELTPNTPVRSLQIIPENELSLLLEHRNESMSVSVEQPCIHQYFEQRVPQIPQNIALICGELSITYAELNTRANVLAHVLIRLGVTHDQLVAICVDRSPAMIICILAILKAGGAYLPLDPHHSSGRLIDILNDGNPKIILADDVGYSTLKHMTTSEYTFVNPNSSSIRLCTNPKITDLSSANLAYVIYTSGSTGKPKGVLIEHRNIVRMLDSSEPLFRFTHTDVWSLWYSITSDVSVWLIWGALCYGGTLVLIPFDVSCSPTRMYHCVCSHKITILDQTPTAFRECIANYVDNPERDHLRLVFLGGERLDPKILRTWFRVRKNAGCKVINMYGPTETTVQATYKLLDETDTQWTFSPIGWRFTHLKIYVLSTNGDPVPCGVTGELYIGGGGVARGYLNRPDLTAICFLPDPFSSSMDGRMYRTGDLVRYLPDGNLEFVGRNDRQLKVRGFRIEPGEIEARLIEYHSVYDAAVVLSGEDHDRRLIAYIVADAEDDLLKNLRTHVAFKLPEYMVPNAFVRVAEIPSTPYGELDIEKLPKPNENDVVRNEYEKPSGEVERGLASAWSAVLGIELIGRHDSFFQMGGNSLQAMRVIERLKVIGITMTVRDLFEHPVLSDAATFLRQHIQFRVPPNLIRLNITKLTPSMLPLIDLTQADIDWIVSKIPGGLNNIQDIYALSSLQEGIFFHYLHAKEGDPYLSMTQLSFKNRSYLERYLGAVQSVVDRHDIFRTAFLWKGISTAAQVVLRRASIHVSQHSFAADGNHSVADELKHRYNPLRCRIDIMEAPLMHFHIAQESDGRWILHELQHHLIADHETIEFMSAEISSFLDHNDTDLPDSIPFRNLVALTRLEMGKEIHERFFTEMLADVTEPSLVFDIHEVFHDGPNIAQSISSLSPQINDRLREQAKLMTTSLATLCHVAWAQVVSRTSNNEKAVFGTVLFGRMGAYNNFANAMGLFMNTLPIRIDVDETPVFECVRRTHTRLANLFSHEHTSLVLAQRCSGIQKGVSLFNSLLNFRHSKIITESESASTSLEFLESMERSNYPLDLSVDDFGKSIQLVTGAVHPLDPSRFCAYMEETLNNLTIALQVKPKMFARSLRILPQTERSIQIDTWNEPITSGVEQPCIHQLFERRASLNPEEIALIFEEHTLTYAELNRRANVVADALLKLGVKPDQPVAICVDRSFAMIVCIIAILKSGGAYLPLDPHHSSQRLIDILYDCKPSIILADEIGQTAMKDIKRSEFTVVDPTTLIIQSRSNPKISDLSSRNLAYIIYTSGSTGKPKGVLVEHRNIVRMFDASGSLFQLSHTDVWSLWYSITSDVSVWLIWGALCYGGKLVLIPFEVACSPTEMYRSVSSNNITVLTQTPSAFKPCIASYVGNPEEDRLRLVLLGGERLYPGILRSWFDMRDNSRCRVINVYGPTEATVQATYKLLSREDTQHTLSPIGRRFTNSKLYILDNNQESVPFGVTGELYIGGGSIARGYHNRPDLTTTRFLSDPFSSAMDGRIYKTGDLVRYLPNGDLDFIGRNDRQFKIRGFRIEPGEIEACLMEYDLVRAAAVVVFGEDHKQRLVAYIVAEAKNNLMRDLRNHTAVRLPDYMVPSAYVRVSEIPLTPNGKLDTGKLPEPVDDDFVRVKFEEPIGELERSLALSWSDVLEIRRISRHDSFFQLGGHSMLAIRLVNVSASRGLKFTLNDLFHHPILCDLASNICSHSQSRSQRRNAIPIQTHGTEPPVFFVPSGSGDISYVFALAHDIRSNHPIYALPWPTIGEDDSIGSLEELASLMVSNIRDIQPEGHYHLCGYSSGGVLAYCIAQILVAMGDSIRFLGFIDTWLPDTLLERQFPEPDPLSVDLADESRHKRYLNLTSPGQGINKLDFVELPMEGQQLQLRSNGAHLDAYANRAEQWTRYTELIYDYVPQDVGLTIHQFYASESVDNITITEIFTPTAASDSSLGWATKLPTSKLNVIPIPGNHDSIMDSLDIRLILCETINSTLSQL